MDQWHKSKLFYHFIRLHLLSHKCFRCVLSTKIFVVVVAFPSFSCCFFRFHSFRAIELIQYSHITSPCWPNSNCCHIICRCLYHLGSNLSTTVKQVSLKLRRTFDAKQIKLFRISWLYICIIYFFVVYICYINLNWSKRKDRHS